MKAIDINCDVGEGIATEIELMPFISSCSIACTGHAGSIETIDKSIRLAMLNNVKIGAHPSFPDRENFGRKFLTMPAKSLQKSLEFQINLLQKRVALHGKTINHIKAHGALYNAMAVDEAIAQIFINACQNTVKNVLLYVPFQSKIAALALQHNIPIKYEAFIDRQYNNNLTLVSRSLPNAVIKNPKKAFEHIYAIMVENKVSTILNKKVSIKADTFCIHGDNVKALHILKYITRQLKENDIIIE